MKKFRTLLFAFILFVLQACGDTPFPGSCNWTCSNVSNPYQNGESYNSMHIGGVPPADGCVGNNGGSHNWKSKCTDPIGG